MSHAARRRGALAAALLFASTPVTPARADVPPSTAPRAELPDFLARKRRMDDEALLAKREGRYVTGLPLANSDPDTGIGFGARVLWFDDGKREDPLFPVTPYRHRAFLQAFATTKGYQYHWLDYDGPYLDGSPWRLRASAVFERNIASNYFGVGNAAMNRLSFPGDPRTFAHYDDYLSELRRLRPDGTAYTRHDQYVLTKPTANVSFERDFFGGVVRSLVGFNASWVDVALWDGEAIRADDPARDRTDVAARQASTRLAADCAANRLVGCEGGFNNELRLGVAYDTRDFEPDPRSGLFVELNGTFAHRGFGSRYDWARLTFSPKAYVTPIPGYRNLVLAGRFLGSVASPDTPFFALRELPFADYDRYGLGGLRTLRGYKQDRFVGRVAMVASLELRWTFAEVRPTKGQRFAFILAPFVDVGRVYDDLSSFTLKGLANGQGAGLRVAWNQATILAFEYGVSREMQAFYVNFNHPF